MKKILKMIRGNKLTKAAFNLKECAAQKNFKRCYKII